MHGINQLATQIRGWLRPPIIAGGEEQTRIAALLNTMLLTLLAIGGAYVLIVPFLEQAVWSGLLANAGTILICLALLALLRRGLVRLACRLFVVMFWLVTTLVAFSYGGVVTPALLSYFSSIVVTGILLGGRAAIGVAGLSVIAGVALVFAEERGLLPVALFTSSSLSMWLIAAVNMLMVAVLQALADRSLRLALRRARHDEQMLAERNEELRREIAERRRVEAEREALIAGLKAKNAELDRFTHTVSHDLKSPLTTIQGFLGRLEKDMLAGDGERMRRDIERIREAGTRMQVLIDDLLSLAQAGQLTQPLQPIALATIVHDARRLVAWRLEAIGAAIDVDPGLPVVYGDPTRLVQVVQNLIDNAVKFRRQRTPLQITIGYAGLDGGLHRLFVRDNGIGVAPQYHEQIFELFTRLDLRSEGTGVGLALARQVIEGHGGRIWIESEGLYRGSTFWFTLRGPPEAT